jgi:hypothetical protein
MCTLAMAQPSAAQSKPVNTRLAEMVEQVVSRSGVSINVSQMDATSVNINRVNGKDVCSPEAEKDVRVLQAAFIEHPNIYQSYSIYLISITKPDGVRTQSDFASLRAKGVFSSDCINLYASIHRN